MTNDDQGDRGEAPTRAQKPTQEDLDRADIDDIDAAEREAEEDEAERERQQNHAALIGAIALVVVIVLAGLGIYSVVVQTRGNGPVSPDISRQMPAAPPSP